MSEQTPPTSEQNNDRMPFINTGIPISEMKISPPFAGFRGTPRDRIRRLNEMLPSPLTRPRALPFLQFSDAVSTPLAPITVLDRTGQAVLFLADGWHDDERGNLYITKNGTESPVATFAPGWTAVFRSEANVPLPIQLRSSSSSYQDSKEEYERLAKKFVEQFGSGSRRPARCEDCGRFTGTDEKPCPSCPDMPDAIRTQAKAKDE